MDALTAIELIEDSDGTVAHEILIEAWQYLVDSGTIHHLQGSYKRHAYRLIANGIINEPTQH